MVLSPDGRTLYVDAGPGIVPVNVATDRAGKPIPVPGNSGNLAMTPDGSTLFIDDGDPATTGPFTVTPVNVRTGRAGHPITVAENPTEVVLSPDGRTLYVAGNDNAAGPDSAGPWGLHCHRPRHGQGHEAARP
jgi:hyaluronoglucosaminidase